ncbi:LysR family transcriptional regulator [Roseibium sp.]|uniref:LysR family transcriptional regulator n=1 Tax=Roseibium sp. TaxID=1936156 RepID=UPI0032640415
MRPSGSDLRLLQVFDAVVRNGGFSAAEVELNLSQSTISNHMTALEQRLGVTLCQRGRRGFRLTEQGQRVHEAACRLESSLLDFSADVGALRGKLAGELRLGILDAIAEDPGNRLPEALALFKSLAPEVKILIAQERPQDLQQKILDGTYHCGIGVSIAAVDGVEEMPLHEEAHGLYCGKSHPLFQVPDDQITNETIHAMPFVQRGYWRKEDKQQHGPGRIEATVFQIEPQLLLIRSGAYLGFLPHHYASKWCEAGKLRHLVPDDFGYTCRFFLMTAKDARRTQVVSTFLETVEKTWLLQDKETC